MSTKHVAIPIGALVEIIRRTVPAVRTGELMSSDSLTAIGVDSIGTLNIVMEASEAFGVDLEGLDTEYDAPTTIGDLRDFLERLPPL